MDFWIPIHLSPARLGDRNSHFMNVVARLKPGVSTGRGARGDDSIARQLAIWSIRTDNQKIGAVVVPMREEIGGQYANRTAGADGGGGMRPADRVREPGGLTAGTRSCDGGVRWRCGPRLAPAGDAWSRR